MPDDKTIPEIAADLWERLATFEGEDADAQLMIEKALREADRQGWCRAEACSHMPD